MNPYRKAVEALGYIERGIGSDRGPEWYTGAAAMLLAVATFTGDMGADRVASEAWAAFEVADWLSLVAKVPVPV